MDGADDLDLSSALALAAYDSGSVQRGVRYAAEGRAVVVESEPGWAAGEVQGTAPIPYRVEITWTDTSKRA